jgi:hypothetical protein
MATRLMITCKMVKVSSDIPKIMTIPPAGINATPHPLPASPFASMGLPRRPAASVVEQKHCP